jgi:hypothetical protein
MTLATVRNEVKRLQARLALRTAKAAPILERLRRQPELLMTMQGYQPDPYQMELLRTGTTANRSSAPKRTLLLCGRQCGKSTIAAALALQCALLEPAALVLLLSPSMRQSAELYRKCAAGWAALGKPVAATAESALRVEFANGSRILSLPGKDDASIRGFSSPSLVVIDEAARVSDALYMSCRPMLAVSPRGRMLALSTPFGKRGWFYEAWHGTGEWQRVKVTADQCQRITPEFLHEEWEALGERWFNQEYMCSFEDLIGAVFRQQDIDAAFDADCQPLFGS